MENKEKQITGLEVMLMAKNKEITIDFLKKELEIAKKQEQVFLNRVQEFSYENEYNMKTIVDTLAYKLASTHQQQYVQALILVLTELEGLEGEVK